MVHRSHPSMPPSLDSVSDLPPGPGKTLPHGKTSPGGNTLPQRKSSPPDAATMGWRLYGTVAFAFVLFVFSLFSLCWSLPAALLYHVLPRRVGVPLGQLVISAGFRFYVMILKVTGLLICDIGALDCLRDEKGVMIAANHPSALDAVLIISRQRRITCIMKALIWDNVFLGGGARLAGYIRNDAPNSMLRKSAEALKNNQKILVFPEGTRTRKAPVGDFAGGFALAAKKAGAPIQTVIIETNLPDFDGRWFLFRKPPFPVVYRARLGRRFKVGDDVQAFVGELHRYFQDELTPPLHSRPKTPQPAV
jgi:1-acyl-sn-glycerol-3-phosphate acyltransferase